MRWFKPNLRSSVSAMFSSGHPSETADSALEEVGIEHIRTSMLSLIGEIEDRKFLHVGRRIRYASEVMGLWYLRGDLMALLASRHGEVQAREHLKAITGMFEDMLPKGLKSRPSPLAARDESNGDDGDAE